MRCVRPPRARRRCPGPAHSRRGRRGRGPSDTSSPRSAATARRVSSMPSTTSPRERRTTSRARSGSCGVGSAAPRRSRAGSRARRAYGRARRAPRATTPDALVQHGAACLLLPGALRPRRGAARAWSARRRCSRWTSTGGDARPGRAPCRAAAAARPVASAATANAASADTATIAARTRARGDGRRSRPRSRRRPPRWPSALRPPAVSSEAPAVAVTASEAGNGVVGRRPEGPQPATRRSRRPAGQSTRPSGQPAGGEAPTSPATTSKANSPTPQRTHIARADLAIGQQRDQPARPRQPGRPVRVSSLRHASSVSRAARRVIDPWVEPGWRRSRRRSAPVRPVGRCAAAGRCLRLSHDCSRHRDPGPEEALRRRRSGARASTSTSAPARCSPSSARTAPARRRRSRSSRGSGLGRTATSACSVEDPFTAPRAWRGRIGVVCRSRTGCWTDGAGGRSSSTPATTPRPRRRRDAGAGGARRPRERDGERALGRSAPATRRRPGTGRAPRVAVPRRAHHGVRPGGETRCLAHDRAAPRDRHHRLSDHARDGRGLPPRRSHRRDRRWSHHRRGDAGHDRRPGDRAEHRSRSR